MLREIHHRLRRIEGSASFHCVPSLVVDDPPLACRLIHIHAVATTVDRRTVVDDLKRLLRCDDLPTLATPGDLTVGEGRQTTFDGIGLQRDDRRRGESEPFNQKPVHLTRKLVRDCLGVRRIGQRPLRPGIERVVT